MECYSVYTWLMSCCQCIFNRLNIYTLFYNDQEVGLDYWLWQEWVSVLILFEYPLIILEPKDDQLLSRWQRCITLLLLHDSFFFYTICSIFLISNKLEIAWDMLWANLKMLNPCSTNVWYNAESLIFLWPKNR